MWTLQDKWVEIHKFPGLKENPICFSEIFQVYFQLDKEREVLRTLRRLLKEKFANSEPDFSPGGFVEEESIIVERHEEWARGR